MSSITSVCGTLHNILINLCHAGMLSILERLPGFEFMVPLEVDAEITDAESTLTRAQQDYLNSIHDYLIALARLEYAMGVTPTPGGSYCHR